MPNTPSGSQGSIAAGATSGVAAGTVALAAAQVGGVLIDGAQPPLQVLGNLVIRITPISITEGLIRLVGRNDKSVLLSSILIVAAVCAAGTGVAFARGRVRPALVAIALLAVLPVIATWGATGVEPERELLVLLPAAALGAVVLRALATPLLPLSAAAGSKPSEAETSGGLARRQMLRAALVIAASTTVGSVVVRRLAEPSAALMRALAAALPRPRKALAPLVDELASVGAAPLTTPTANFYRIDTSLSPPRVDPESWLLTLSRDGERLRAYTYLELLDRSVHEADITIGCVSNEIGGDLIGTARWQGVLLSDLLAEAGITSAGRISGVSVDGFVASFEAKAAFDGRPAMVAIGMNGRPLPVRHGFPARIVVPGLYGYTSAVKWLRAINVSDGTDLPGFWADRGWTPTVTVHVTSRIDSPRSGGRVPAGTVQLAGIAWAPVSGVSSVELQVDDGPWVSARLSTAVSGTIWRQWALNWMATPGEHIVRVRATDLMGLRQDTTRRPVFPSGATGLHEIRITVTTQ